MNREDVSTLLTKLRSATASGAVRWSETPDEEVYRLDLPVGMIHVSAHKVTKHAEGQPLAEKTAYEATFRSDPHVVPFAPQSSDEEMLLQTLYEEVVRQVARERQEFLRRLEKSLDEEIARGERDRTKPRPPQVEPSPFGRR